MKKEIIYKISREEIIESIMKQENITGKVTMSKLSSEAKSFIENLKEAMDFVNKLNNSEV